MEQAQNCEACLKQTNDLKSKAMEYVLQKYLVRDLLLVKHVVSITHTN